MTKRFAAVVDDSTPTQQNAISEWVRDAGFGFWHYYSDLWLLVDWSNGHTTSSIRDKLRDLTSGASNIVIQVQHPDDWAAFGNKESFEWLNTVWLGKGAP